MNYCCLDHSDLRRLSNIYNLLSENDLREGGHKSYWKRIPSSIIHYSNGYRLNNWTWLIKSCRAPEGKTNVGLHLTPPHAFLGIIFKDTMPWLSWLRFFQTKWHQSGTLVSCTPAARFLSSCRANTAILTALCQPNVVAWAPPHTLRDSLNMQQCVSA